MSQYEDGTYWENNEGYHEEDAAFKAANIMRICKAADIDLSGKKIIDIGCGSGKVLSELSKLVDGEFSGVDVSPYAISRAKSLHESDKVQYDISAVQDVPDGAYDFLFSNDVFEHVDDYIGFLREAKKKAKVFYFNIPLDMTVMSVLLGRYQKARQELGHLHYFSKISALETLKHAGFEIVHHEYNDNVWQILKTHKKPTAFLAAGPRVILKALHKDFGVNLMGGASLGVVCRPS